MSDRESWRNVGRKIRYLRKTHRLTIKQLAAGCGLSPNAISLLERGEVAPTVATLCKVASALGASPGSFFQEVCPNEVVFTRAGDQRLDQKVDQVLHTLKCATPSPSELPESEDVELAGKGPKDRPVYSPEFVLCLNGCLEYQANGHSYQLEPGDSLTFNGNVLHCWHSLGSGPAVAIMVIRTEQNPASALPDSALEGE